MTPAERTAKIAELRAEADRLEREGKRDPIAGLLDAKDYFTLIWIAPDRGFGPDYMTSVAKSAMQAIDERIAALSELTIKTPDAPEPTGAELVGKMCEFSDDGKEWTRPSSVCKEYSESGFSGHGYYEDAENGWRWKFARLAKEQP